MHFTPSEVRVRPTWVARHTWDFWNVGTRSSYAKVQENDYIKSKTDAQKLKCHLSLICTPERCNMI